MYETMMAGPAWFAAAVPVSTKIPVPMIAPMPKSVRSHADRLRLSDLPPCSTSPTSCSIDLVLNRFESIHPPQKHPIGQSPRDRDPAVAGNNLGNYRCVL